MVTLFKCVVCGKLTTGRLPRASWEPGDTTGRYPRRHKGKDGKPCPGNIKEAEWVDLFDLECIVCHKKVTADTSEEIKAIAKRDKWQVLGDFDYCSDCAAKDI